MTTSRGTAAAGIFVLLWDAKTRAFRGNAFTDANGKYSIVDRTTMDPTRVYKVQFRNESGDDQWAHQKRSFEEADTVTVEHGSQATVDEQLFAIPSGTVTFTATDTATGARVPSFCANLSGRIIRFQCTQAGLVTMPDIPAGQYAVFTSSNGDDFHMDDSQSVTVTADQTTAVDFRMAPAGVIEATVTDAATNAPVEKACVALYEGIGGISFNNSSGYCSESDGRARAVRIPAGTYRLYVNARDGRHGSQWVGSSGGTGRAALAKTVTVTAGATTRLPVRLDGAGSITGTLLDKATGAPAVGVCAFPYSSIAEGFETTPNCTDKDGKYVIDNLGPYWWPVEFVDGRGRYLFQWSGGQPTQLTAKLLHVRVGQSTVENAGLVTGGTSIAGRVTGKDGRAADGRVAAFNAITGDWIAFYRFTDQDGNYLITGVTGTQPVKLQFRGNSSDKTVWYRDSATFQTARPVLVRAGSPVSGIDIVVP